jgi:hypothetical protein
MVRVSGVVLRDQFDRALGRIHWRFPKRVQLQVVDNRMRFFEKLGAKIGRQRHLQLVDGSRRAVPRQEQTDCRAR